MSDQLTVQLQKMEGEYQGLKKYFESDGKVTADERRILDAVQAQIVALRQKVTAVRGDATKAAPAPAKPPTKDFLTEKSWKAVLQAHAGKLNDNGLQRALAAYEKLSQERIDERLKVLQLVFKLALDLSTKVASSLADVKEYLSKVCEHSLKAQEALDKQKKAGGVGATDKTMLRKMIVDSAKDIAQSAKTNTALFGVEVLKACKAFEIHAKAKLDDLTDEVTAQELLGSLVSMVVPKIGEKLAESVASELGKKLVKKMTDAIGDKLTGVMKSAGKDSSKKALEKAVGDWVVGAQDSQGAVLGVVMQNLVPLCDRVIADVNAGKELSPQLTAFIEPFVLEQTGKLDAMLETRFGVPSPAKSKQTQLKIFKDMVRVFQEKVLIAKVPDGEKMEWNIKGIPEHIRRNAEATAQQASKQREKEMDAAPR